MTRKSTFCASRALASLRGLVAPAVLAGGLLQRTAASADEPPAVGVEVGATTPSASAPTAGPAAPAPSPAPSAQSFTPTPVPPFTPQPEATAPARPARDVRDAHGDRVIFLPTAYTHPAGTVYLSTYDIVLLQAGYAITDSTQLSLTSTIPIEGLVFADLTLKSVVAKDGPVRVAAIGSATGIWGLDVGNSVLGRVGAIAEMCIDDACRSSASLGGTVLLGGPATVAATGVGFIWRAISWMAILAEADTLVPFTLPAGRIHGLSINAGVRFPHRVWSLDLTLVRPLGVENAPTIPFAAFTVRFLP